MTIQRRLKGAETAPLLPTSEHLADRWTRYYMRILHALRDIYNYS